MAYLPLCLQGDSLVMLALEYLHDASTTSKVSALRFLRQLLGSPSVSCWQLPCFMLRQSQPHTWCELPGCCSTSTVTCMLMIRHKSCATSAAEVTS